LVVNPRDRNLEAVCKLFWRGYEAPQVFLSNGTKLEKPLNRIGELKSFSIVLKYSDGTQLLIPVEADKIRPEKANCLMSYSAIGQLMSS